MCSAMPRQEEPIQCRSPSELGRIPTRIGTVTSAGYPMSGQSPSQMTRCINGGSLSMVVPCTTVQQVYATPMRVQSPHHLRKPCSEVGGSFVVRSNSPMATTIPLGVALVLEPVAKRRSPQGRTPSPMLVARPLQVSRSVPVVSREVFARPPVASVCSVEEPMAMSAPSDKQRPPVIHGLQIRFVDQSRPGVRGDLYAYLPPQLVQSEVVEFGDDGEELFQLPPLWMVMRAAGCPMLWIQLQEAMPLPSTRCVLLVEWEHADDSLLDAVHATLLGDHSPGGSRERVAVAVDEGLIRAESGRPQARALLEPHCGHTLRLWLRHAQQMGMVL